MNTARKILYHTAKQQMKIQAETKQKKNPKTPATKGKRRSGIQGSRTAKKTRLEPPALATTFNYLVIFKDYKNKVIVNINILNNNIHLLANVIKKGRIKSKKVDTACKDAIAFNLTGFVVTIVSEDDALFLSQTSGEQDVTWEDCNSRQNLWGYLQSVKDLGGATFTPRLSCKMIPKGKQESDEEYIVIDEKEDESDPGEGQGLGRQTGRGTTRWRRLL
jgi:hypothetical protein